MGKNEIRHNYSERHIDFAPKSERAQPDVLSTARYGIYQLPFGKVRWKQDVHKPPLGSFG